MKTFFTVFFAILAAAAVIFTALWAKSRVDDWGRAWRSCDAQMSAIVSTETALSRSSLYSSSFSSPEVAMQEVIIATQRLEDDEVRIAEIQRTMVTILEDKPFGLPLTAAERNDLESAKAYLQKHPDSYHALGLCRHCRFRRTNLVSGKEVSALTG